MSNVFWQKWLLHTNRWAISVVRNDYIAREMRRKVSIRFDNLANSGGGWMLTLHVGNFFLNVDWV